MCFMKCYLARNPRGYLVNAQQAVGGVEGRIWTGISCGCRLILHAGLQGTPPSLNMP
ncbi:hypothetical protein GEA64_23150 [Photorhabdus khanii]|uniref:DUF7828 domain-containing protein n=2 Tax=Photorhabdus khanii TaxID=1004150 RepID=A0A7C9GM17_9GAMM|nr:hypothetical protein [Photorhabdus khanii]